MGRNVGVSALKVKVFCSCHLRALERAVNEFIKDKCVISIKQSQVKGRVLYMTITILYDDTFDGGYVKFKLDEEIQKGIDSMKNR
jgi:hypothetical protein